MSLKSLKTAIIFICVLLTTTTTIVAQESQQEQDRFQGPWSTKYGDMHILNRYDKQVDLNQYADNEILKEEVLSFTRTNESREIWGSGKRIDAVFDHEILPAFFERELVLTEMELDSGKIRWVFNGNEGGFTVQISKDSVHLYQRYYDSFGYYRPTKDAENGTHQLAKNYRHPNSIWLASATKISGQLKTVKIRTDHTYRLVLEVNGKQVARQATNIDVFRNQIQFTDGIKEVEGSIYKPATLTSKDIC